MEMEEQYGITDLTHYMNGKPIFTAIPPPEILSSGHHNHHVAQQHYEMVMEAGVGGILFHGGSDSTNNTAASLTGTSTTASLSAGGGGLEMEMEIGGGYGCGTGRWPRQETLTLLEVRSRLDSKFKEANQKGPLWDEVSRIMSEEHGYQRSGKKCREKFENLYKYYKKTKDGKAGRQDGKHYRFFRQLEALYGETSSTTSVLSETHNNLVGLTSFQAPNSQPNYQHEPFRPPPRICCDSPSLSNSSAFDTSSSESMENRMNKRRGKRSWKVKIKDFIDWQMMKLMEKQEASLEKMVKTIEHKERERILREEEWRKKEAARIERDHKFWANERAWIEARDAAFMEALHKLTENKANSDNPLEESEITRLMQLRRGMETSFQQGGCLEEVLWEEIAAKTCLGYDWNGLMCKAKWDSVNGYLATTNKRKENRSSSYSYQVLTNGKEDERSVAPNHHHHGASPSPTTTSHVNENGYRFLMGDPENMWESYGMKLTKQGEN